MNKSFDQIIRERLSSLETNPPDRKEAIFKAIAPPEDTSVANVVYQVVSALLILIAFYQIGSVKNETSGVTKRIESNDISSQILKSPVVSDPPQREGLIPGLATESALISESANEMIPEDSMLPADLGGVSVHFPEYNQLSRKERKEFLLAADFHLDRSYYRIAGITPSREQSITPYFNAGAFFLYNRLRPNLSDDIYIGSYDGPFSISHSRIGINLDAGIEKRLTELFALRIGAVFNNYNQQYSFMAHGTQPDSVSYDEESEVLEPHFEKQDISISKRVTTIGFKAVGLWYIFPNRSNALTTSVEYARLIGSGPQFTYNDQPNGLMDPHQVMVAFGLRKTLLKTKQGQIFLLPNIRYALKTNDHMGILKVRPFSVGLTISYGLE